MNRDGFRADRETAEHEAAHAVIAVLTGRIVYKVSIAPSEQERGDCQGWMWCTGTGMPPAPWADADVSEAGSIDVFAAGFAWELLAAQRARSQSADRHQPSDGLLTQGLPEREWRRVQECARLDRRGYDWLSFLIAADRVRQILRRPEVAAAVEAVADALQARKTGEFPGGTTVDKIVMKHVPGLARRRHPDGRLVGGLVPAATVTGATTDSGLGAAGGVPAWVADRATAALHRPHRNALPRPHRGQGRNPGGLGSVSIAGLRITLPAHQGIGDLGWAR